MATRAHESLSAGASAAQAPGARARLRAALARVPAAALVCALAAFLNAAAWSILTPAFQVPDEQSHYAYTEYLVQHGRPPVPAPEDTFSDSQTLALRDLKLVTTQFEPANGVIWTSWEQRRLEHDLALEGGLKNGNGSGKAVGGEPPLYYALEAVPYRLAQGGTLLDRLALMRLLSALLGGVTVLFVFLFLREALPRQRWAWTVGALGVAFNPLFGFMSGSVNSDALLYAAAAALFFLLARGFRRGLTRPLAIGIGATLATGALTKFNYFGLVPATVLALLVLGVRREGALRLRALALPALALGVAAVPVLLEMALNASAWDRPTIGASASSFAIRADIHPSLGGLFDYVWQFYLVPLPGSAHPIGDFPLWEIWISGYVGRLGWVDTEFRPSVSHAAIVPLALVAALAASTLVAERRALWRRRVELLVYLLLGVSFVVFVAAASYVIYLRFQQSVAQPRYLLPLLALYGGVLALAARGAGRRATPAVGTAIVVLAIAHDVFSQLLLVSRFYA